MTNRKASLPMAILCDEYLPDGDAFILNERLKDLSAVRNIPFLVISAKPTTENKLRALYMGIDDYYDLNASAEELDQCISFLHRHKQDISKGTGKESLHTFGFESSIDSEHLRD